MSREDKAQFVIELIDSIKDKMLGQIKQVPAGWDGYQLRQWIVDTFADQAAFNKMGRQEMKAYKNDVIVNNL